MLLTPRSVMCQITALFKYKILDCILLHSITEWCQVTFWSFCQEADSKGEKALDEMELCPEGPVSAQACSPTFHYDHCHFPTSPWLLPSWFTKMGTITPTTLGNLLSIPEDFSQDFGSWVRQRAHVAQPCLCVPIGASFSADDQVGMKESISN